MNFKDIPSAFYDVGRATSAKLLLYARNNFRHNEERILAQEATTPELPPGFILAYGGSAAPTGYLLCNGDLVLRADQPDLFAIIGVTYNIGGEASTHFRLPDLRGRIPMGQGTSSAGTVRTIGAKVGAETVTLATAELPSHTHTVNDPGHTHQAAHGPYGGGMTPGIVEGNNNNQSPQTGWPTSSALAGYSSVVANTPAGSAHNNVQPSLPLNFIIKT